MPRDRDSGAAAGKLAGKVALVTGASSGIGRATAVLLASRGATVVACARRSEPLQQLGRTSGGQILCLAADLSTAPQAQGVVDLTVNRFGRIDILVNNAGSLSLARVEQARLADWERMIDVNFKAPLYCVAAVLPFMRRQGSGHIVNVSSVVAGGPPPPGAAVYAATKSALSLFSEGLRREVGPQIRVSVISPGTTATELFDHSADPDLVQRMRGSPDRAIRPESVARTILFALDQPAEVALALLEVRPARPGA